MKYRSEFICGGANTVASSACWTRFEQLPTGNKEVVAYCVDNLVAVVDVSKSVVIETLRGHTKRINVLKASKNFLISASEDSTIRVWNHGQNSSWEKYAVLSGVMSSSIIALSCLDATCGLLIAAADVSGKVAIWSKRNSADEFVILQIVDMPSAQMPHELHLSELPGSGPMGAAAKMSIESDILLLIGSVDTRVHIRLASQQNILSCLNTPKSTPEISSSGIFKLVGTLPGHEEWITCLATIVSDSRTLLLASGSKDAKIRIWRISLSPQSSISISTDLQQLDKFKELDIADEDKDEEEDALDAQDGAIDIEPDESLSEARLMFVTPSGFVCSVFLEALLVGHEDWVSSVHWMDSIAHSESNILAVDGNTTKAKDTSIVRVHRLYSTSMDRNMVIWAPETPSGVWTPTVRVGDIGGQLGGSVGGNLLGFVGGCLSPDCNRMLGVGYGGSFHLWSRSDVEGGEAIGGVETEMWMPKSFLGGHFESVNDLVWCPSSEYVLTVSSDQTCRLHAPVLRTNQADAYDNNLVGKSTHTSTPIATSTSTTTSTAPHNRWREVSRPQIHGYDLHSIAVAPSSSSYLLYSAADEKIIRVFDAPSSVIDGLMTLCGVDRTSSSTPHAGIKNLDPSAPRVRRAYIPELGLSNRASETMSNLEKSEQDARNVQTLDWSNAPLEGQLADYTVWPEVQKMYGHNNGVVCVTISHCGRWLASASKARDRETAVVLLWDTVKYCCVGSLDGHDSTVVCVSFSPNDRYLVSSGKDRAICISVSSPIAASAQPYVVAAVVPAAHKRIVWASSWSGDGSLLATGSRDGVCKVWAVTDDITDSASGTEGSVNCVCLHSFSPFEGVSVTALAFGPPIAPLSNSWILALGAETGDINYWDVGSSNSTILLSTSSAHCHGSAVKKLDWTPDSIIRPFVAQGGDSVANGNTVNDVCGDPGPSSVWRIGSCGEDHTVRIFQITQ